MKHILIIAMVIFTMNVFAQVSKTITVSSGNLSSSLSANEKSTVSNLMIKGTIDARDFKIIRDDMPVLAVLDISDVKVETYYGMEGTGGSINIIYPANEIPVRAFCTTDNVGKISLNTIKLPSSITSIGNRSLLNCTGLSSVVIPKSVLSIERSAFNSCTNMSSVIFESPSSLTYIDTMDFRNCDKLKTITIPSTVSTIDYAAFYDCNELTSILFESKSNLTTIGESVFSYCTKTTEISIPSTVTSIGDYAFYNCSGFINVDKNNPNYSSEDGILFNKSKTTLIQCPTSWNKNYNIPNSVSLIGLSAFSRCNLLTGITIPSSVTVLESSAFWGCTSLKGSIKLPSSVRSIGSYAFSGCSNLTAIYCYAIKPINIGSSEEVFYNVNKSNCVLYVPKGSAIDYQSAYQWYEFENIIEMPGFSFSSNSIKIEAVQESKATIDITSDVVWKAVSDQSWLSVSPGSGNGNSKLTFTATANPTSTIRSAIVTVSATGVESRTISVVQSYILQPKIIKLYDFDCKYPYSLLYRSNLVNDGTFIYGIMTDFQYENRFLIKIKPDGKGFQQLYTFENSKNSDFISISENEIYGKIDGESIFKINTDGSNYSEIDLSDEIGSEESIGSFVVSGNVLYGTFERIVADGIGTRIFKINTDGTGFSSVYSSDGINGLYISENTLISFKDDGFINREMFRINSDGSEFFNFGITSVIKIIIKESVIYGEAFTNTGDEWIIFKVNLDGSGYTILKLLSYSLLFPFQSFSISGNTLFGMSDNNEIFKINLDGTDFKQIHTDMTGQDVWCEPTLIGEKLCGLASENWINTFLYQINTSNDDFSKVFKFGTSTSGMLPMGTLIESGNFLFGTTITGGEFGAGTLFSINKDGSNYTKLFDFDGVETGSGSLGHLTLIGDEIYGTLGGGFIPVENGCIFKIKTNGEGFRILHKFDETNGSSPNGSLVFNNGNLYGITSEGGKNSHGVIFRINIDGTGFTNILDLTSEDTGERPENGIIVSDDVIYCVSSIDYGSVFSLNINGTGLRKIFEMNDISGDFSYCKPLLINDELYITTSEGGENGVGTIFKIKTDGTGFTVLYNYEGIDDSYGSGFRNNSLMLHNWVLYGTATGNGINDHGYLYKINLDGTGFTKLSDFNGEYGSMPYLCDLIIDNNNDIYGMTTLGGKYSGGIIYKYSLGDPSTSVQDIAGKTLIQVFPNPTNGNLQLSFNLVPEPETWIAVYDISGKVVLKTQVFNKEEIINLKGKMSGLYFIKVNQGTTTNTFKIVLK